ncbi:MAG: translation elongation factor Ts [Phycisphaerae bacterium]
MEISAAVVKAFRDKTGLPMMECKQALIEAKGDEKLAEEILKKKGLTKIGKLAGRETTQGRVTCFVDATAKAGAIVKLSCETAPVANTEDFTKLATQVARHAAVTPNPTPDSLRQVAFLDDRSRTLGDYMDEVINRIRENVKVAAVDRLTGVVGSYTHFNGQSGTLIEMSAPCPDAVMVDVCMHITAMKPPIVRREQADPESVARERAAAAAQAAGKPPAVVEKIVEGKLGRWFSEFVLLEQPFVKEDKISVAAFLKSAAPNLTVNRFVRLAIGE